MGEGLDQGVHPFAPQLHVTREALAALANSASPARGPYLPYPWVAASTWGFGVPGGRASLAGKRLRSYVIEWDPSQGSLLLDGLLSAGTPISRLRSLTQQKPEPLGVGGTGWGSTPAPCKGRRKPCLVVGVGQGVRDGQRSVALLVAVWH